MSDIKGPLPTIGWITQITGKFVNSRKIILYSLVKCWLKYKNNNLEEFKNFKVIENKNISELLGLNIDSLCIDVNIDCLLSDSFNLDASVNFSSSNSLNLDMKVA